MTWLENAALSILMTIAAGTLVVVSATTSPLGQSSDPDEFEFVDGKAWFLAYSHEGREVWVTDGTAAGTSRVATAAGLGASHIDRITPFGSGVAIITSTGARQTIVALAPEEPDQILWSGGDHERALNVAGSADSLFFMTQAGDIATLWKSNGPAAVPVIVQTIATNHHYYFGVFQLHEEKLFFQLPTTQGSFWVSDGTAGGTFVISARDARYAVSAGSILFFSSGAEVWRTDGTTAGTWKIGASRFDDPLLGVAGENLLFRNDGPAGEELWKSDGTVAGTSLLRDIRPGPDSSGIFRGFTAEGYVYFGANPNLHSSELWRSDGSEGGTHLVRDIMRGVLSALDQRRPFSGAAAGDVVLFDWQSSTDGREVWVTDGTEEGTRLLIDLTRDRRSSSPEFVGAINGRAIFAADNAIHGREPWSSDGTEAGTGMLANVAGESTLSGTITAAGGGAVAGASVALFDSGFQSMLVQFPVDSSGNYRVEGLRAGSYLIRTFNSGGYIDQLHEGISCSPCALSQGTLIPIGEREQLAGPPFVLSPGARISGQTRTTTGVPWSPLISVFSGEGVRVTGATADSDGRYTTEGGLLPGVYHVQTSLQAWDGFYCGGGCAPTDGTPLTVGGSVEGIDFIITPQRQTINAVVTDEELGFSLGAEAEATIYSHAGQRLRSARADDAGVVALSSLWPGEYIVAVAAMGGYVTELYDNVECNPSCDLSSATRIRLTPESSETIHVELSPAGPRIIGTVVDAASGEPVAAAHLEVFDAAGQRVTMGWTMADGRYAIPRSAGTYTMRASRDGFLTELYGGLHCRQCDVRQGTAVVVGADGVRDIDFALDRGATIAGKVTATEGGQPLAGIEVSLRYQQGSTSVASIGPVATGGDGSYRFEGLYPDTYFAFATSDDYDPELFDDVRSPWFIDPAATPLTVDATTRRDDIDFSLEKRPVVSGRVIDRLTGSPIAAQVTLSRVGGSYIYAASDAEGNFCFSPVPSGTYDLIVSAAGYRTHRYPDIDCSYTTGWSCSGAPGFVLTPGVDRTDLTFSLARTVRIDGTVTEAGSGMPLAGIRVHAFHGDVWVISALTDDEGHYSLRSPHDEGTYTLLAGDGSSRSHHQQLYQGVDCLRTCPWPLTGGTAIEAAAGATLTGMNFSLTPYIGPQVDTIHPSRLPAAGGSVTVSGSGFYPDQWLMVGTHALQWTVNESGTEATVAIPALPGGSLQLVQVSDVWRNSQPVNVFVQFADVAAGSPFEQFIETIFRSGITAGCGSGAFCPDSGVTRAQMAVFLLRTKYGASWTPPPATGNVFADVPADGFAAAWIEQLAAEGITAGCGGSGYCPETVVTREQMAVFLLRASADGSYVPPAAVGVFDDVPISSPFAPWVEELAHRGITAGCGPAAFCPNGEATRAQMAVFLTKAFGLELAP